MAQWRMITGSPALLCLLRCMSTAACSGAVIHINNAVKKMRFVLQLHLISLIVSTATYGNVCWFVASCICLQANQQLQQQIDTLHQEASDKAASFSSQAQALEAEKTALQQELTGLSQKLKAAESGKLELTEQQDLWKSKCCKYQQVWSPAKYISATWFCFPNQHHW